MKTWDYPDGSKIEIGYGDSYPPGWTGQHTNVSRTWLRKNGGEWITATRSDHSIRFFLDAAENADDAMIALEASNIIYLGDKK